MAGRQTGDERSRGIGAAPFLPRSLSATLTRPHGRGSNSDTHVVRSAVRTRPAVFVDGAHSRISRAAPAWRSAAAAVVAWSDRGARAGLGAPLYCFPLGVPRAEHDGHSRPSRLSALGQLAVPVPVISLSLASFREPSPPYWMGVSCYPDNGQCHGPMAPRRDRDAASRIAEKLAGLQQLLLEFRPRGPFNKF